MVVVRDEFMDFALELGDRVKRAAANRQVCDEPEPAFDLIEPGGVGGRVVHVIAHLGVALVGVVDDQMHLQMLGNALDVLQEGEELLMPMTFLALRKHLAVGYKDEITSLAAYVREWGGPFVVPIPEVKIL